MIQDGWVVTTDRPTQRACTLADGNWSWNWELAPRIFLAVLSTNSVQNIILFSILHVMFEACYHYKQADIKTTACSP